MCQVSPAERGPMQQKTILYVCMLNSEVVGDTLSNDGLAGGQIPTGDLMFPVSFVPCIPSAP